MDQSKYIKVVGFQLQVYVEKDSATDTFPGFSILGNIDNEY